MKQQDHAQQGANPASTPQRHRVIVVGTGFSGLCMGVKLREAGEDDFVLLERAHEVGGTWRDNTYPGCGCDVPSHLYSFSFAPTRTGRACTRRRPRSWPT